MNQEDDFLGFCPANRFIISPTELGRILDNESWTKVFYRRVEILNPFILDKGRHRKYPPRLGGYREGGASEE
jgi:hypothetical protein